MMKENLKSGVDQAEEGRNLFNRVVITGAHIPIRPAFQNPYVMRGSFHMLANALKLGGTLHSKRLAKAFDKAIGEAK